MFLVYYIQLNMYKRMVGAQHFFKNSNLAKSHQANPFFYSNDRRLSAPPEPFLVYSPIRHATNGAHRDMLIFYINTNFFITLDFYCPGISTSRQMSSSLPDPHSPYKQTLRIERQNSVWYPSRPHLIILFALLVTRYSPTYSRSVIIYTESDSNQQSKSRLFSRTDNVTKNKTKTKDEKSRDSGRKRERACVVVVVGGLL